MDTTTARRPRQGRGRRPVDEVRRDVLHAVGVIVLTDGLSALTIDGAAKASGVSKTTIHKWWPSRGALALDGYFHAVASRLSFPDTGDLRADIETQLRSFVSTMTTTPGGSLLRELIGAAQTDPELLTAYRALYSSGRRRLAVERMQRGQEAGQLRSDVDPRVLVDQLWGAVYHRLLIPDEPVDEAFAAALVTNLFVGIQPPRSLTSTLDSTGTQQPHNSPAGMESTCGS